MIRAALPIRTLAVAVLLLAPRTALLAQSPASPALQEVVRLSQDGYADSARAAVAKILAKTSPSEPLYAEALFTAAMVARTGEEMKLNYSRVAIEFSSSAWADKAILRLAQLDYGSGNSESAVGRIRRLFNDYPTSSILPAAALWGSRAAFDRKEMQLGCEWITKGIAVVGDDVELKNQLEFAKQRCNVGAGVEVAPSRPDSLRSKPIETPPARPDSARARPVTTVVPPPPAPATASVTGAPWRIQVAAISDKAAIRRAVAKIEQTGLKAFQVAGPRGLTKVQAGPFKTRDAAAAKLPAVRAALGGAPFVVQVP